MKTSSIGDVQVSAIRAVAGYGGDPSDVLIATKGGYLRPGDGSWTQNGSSEYLKEACDASLSPRRGASAIPPGSGLPGPPSRPRHRGVCEQGRETAVEACGGQRLPDRFSRSTG